MKALKKAIPLAIGTLFLAAGAQATTLDFNSTAVGTSDPTVGVVHFSAGDPTLFDDTIVDNSNTTLGTTNYLLNGYSDGSGLSPDSSGNAFVAVTRTDSTHFGTVSVDFALLNFLPPSSTFTLEALLGGSLVGSTAPLVINDNLPGHMLSLDLSATASGADELLIYDSTDIGDIFALTSFSYTDFTPQGCTGPNCGGGPGSVPEPSALWLLGAGMLGMGLSKRRKAS